MAKVNFFLSVQKRLLILGPENSPPKFQPKIQSKFARIKTRTESKQTGVQSKNNAYHYVHNINKIQNQRVLNEL